MPLHELWRLFGRRSPWPRRFLGRAAHAAGFDAIATGEPLTRDVLFVANHISWIDILVLAGVTGSRFVAKSEVESWPVVGWLAGLNATIYVRRTERGRAAVQADRLREALAEGAPVTLFAEGSTGDGLGIRPFRASLLAALAPPPPGVMLQPVVLDYGPEAPLIAWPDELDAGQDAMRILALPGRRTVTLRFLAAIDPAATPDRKLLAAKAREAMCEALGGNASEPV